MHDAAVHGATCPVDIYVRVLHTGSIPSGVECRLAFLRVGTQAGTGRYIQHGPFSRFVTIGRGATIIVMKIDARSGRTFVTGSWSTCTRGSTQEESRAGHGPSGRHRAFGSHRTFGCVATISRWCDHHYPNLRATR